MSAVEKLGTLGDEHTRALEEDSGTLQPYLLYDVLPQIVAVVEAAELLKARGHSLPHPCPLCDSLAALDEALTTRTEPRTAAESTK